MPDSRTHITIPVSPGELVDRLTILEIKIERMTDAAQLASVRRALSFLTQAAERSIPESNEMRALHDELKAVNERLWEIEDDIRDCERKGDFGDAFITLARAVYRTNDERAALKRKINEILGSEIMDEKSYAPY